jgi:UDP-N-acetylmuramyl pentapeptide phosphotransferase/UDP-N-acetylglucosamine-1-phosphate transferase
MSSRSIIVFGFALAAVICAMVSVSLIGLLQRAGAKQNVSTNAPSSHTAKQGVPTLGGLGLDGLSSSLIIPAAIAVGYLAMGHSISAALMCSVIGGSVLGFLWCNSHPASVIMGDTGSLALGGMLATLSLTGNCVFGAVVATMPIWVIVLS